MIGRAGGIREGIESSPYLEKREVVAGKEKSSVGILERMKNKAVRVWGMCSFAFHTVGDKLGFVFFRTLEWIHPSLGPKIENVFLRLGGAWQSMKQAWREEAVRKEVEQLKGSNQELRAKVYGYDKLLEEKEALRSDCDALLRENRDLQEKKKEIEARIEWSTLQERNWKSREREVEEQRAILMEANQELEERGTQLMNERDQLKNSLEKALSRSSALEVQLVAKEQKKIDVEFGVRLVKQMGEKIESLQQIAAKDRQIGQSRELDRGLEELLPLFLSQLQEIQNQCTEIREGAQEDPSSLILLDRMERICKGIYEYIEKIPPLFKLHKNWGSQIYSIPVSQS